MLKWNATLCQTREKEKQCLVYRFGETEPGTTTVTIKRDNTIIVIRNILAEAWKSAACGEAYLNSDAMRRLEQIVEESEQVGGQGRYPHVCCCLSCPYCTR
jgi:quinol monooxygenase YgiN